MNEEEHKTKNCCNISVIFSPVSCVHSVLFKKTFSLFLVSYDPYIVLSISSNSRLICLHLLCLVVFLEPYQLHFYNLFSLPQTRPIVRKKKKRWLASLVWILEPRTYESTLMPLDATLVAQQPTHQVPFQFQSKHTFTVLSECFVLFVCLWLQFLEVIQQEQSRFLVF